MKNRRFLFYVLILTQLFITLTPIAATASPLHNPIDNTTTSIEPRTDDIRWQYATIDGIFCRRLYNYTTKIPVTDWQPLT